MITALRLFVVQEKIKGFELFACHLERPSYQAGIR
jgi:hypothetical protein